VLGIYKKKKQFYKKELEIGFTIPLFNEKNNQKKYIATKKIISDI